MTLSDVDLNVNINVNVNIKVNFFVEDNLDSWASLSENNVRSTLIEEIKIDREKEELLIKKAIEDISIIFDGMNVDFEPDPEYRENVKNMIRGLVLSQLLKQKTINLYRKGKEDREYLSSFLMMKVQTYLLNTCSITIWDEIIKMLYKKYHNIRITDEIKQKIKEGIAQHRLIPKDTLISSVLTNKKNYKIRRSVDPINYI